jgi:uncharacterized protein
MTTTSERVADALDLEADSVASALHLLDDDNTVPFIARYRKDATGGLDETQIREVRREAQRLRDLESRRQTILETIREQGALDDQLREAIEAADSKTALEDLYAPYRPKRRTRGKKALEAGLEPVADALMHDGAFQQQARDRQTDEYPSTSAVLDGAADIIAERVADDPDIRKYVRQRATRQGAITCKRRRGADKDPNFENYYGFQAPVTKIEPHQVLAIRRGENEKALSASLEVDDDAFVGWIRRQIDRPDGGEARRRVDAAIEDAWQRLLHPRTERHIRGELEEQADDHAIGVFAVNLKNLLMQPPLPDRSVLGVDPGYRSGCKLAAVDREGRFRASDKMFVHDDRKQGAIDTIREMVDTHEIDVVAIGNGTASRETERAVADALDDVDAVYAMVDEAGASVYSASETAQREFPDLDVSIRGAISIARRLQDPLAELVKIDPESIGVGMYQHDVDDSRLSDELAAVVEDVVHAVGIDLNTASRDLLAHVSGIGPTLADRIVEYRNDHGLFESRRQLDDVHGVGAKTFEQAAGFLRIRDGAEPLDNTSIHPDNYAIARRLLDTFDGDLGGSNLSTTIDGLDKTDVQSLANRTDAGVRTVESVLEALAHPGRDPRDDVDPPELRSDVLSMEDLTEGMKVGGTVRNVVDFGAFVDIGVKEDGLVHVSEMADRYVDDPHEIVAVGDRIDVVVQSIDIEQGRIGLSMKQH